MFPPCIGNDNSFVPTMNPINFNPQFTMPNTYNQNQVNNIMMMQYYANLMQNPEMNLPGMISGGNEFWMQGYNMGMNEVNSNVNDSQVNKTNVIFKTTQGVVTNLSIEEDKTMSELIKTYLNRVGKPELFSKKDGVCFLFNAAKVDFNCPTKISQFFGFHSHPTLIVNDVNNLIGA